MKSNAHRAHHLGLVRRADLLRGVALSHQDRGGSFKARSPGLDRASLVLGAVACCVDHGHARGFQAIAKGASLTQNRYLGRLLRELARKHQGKISRAIQNAISGVKDAATLTRIAQSIVAGRVDEALGAIDVALRRGALDPIVTEITSAFTAGGTFAASRMVNEVFPVGRTPAGVTFQFNVLNPKTAEQVYNYSYSLISEISSSIRETVRHVMTDGVISGRNPLDIARDLRDSIGLTERQTMAVENYRRLLENGSSEALSRGLRDRRFDGTIEAGDLTPEQIERMVERYRERYVKYRSETIARTEAIRSVNAGNLEMWRQAAEEGRVDPAAVRRFWIYTSDGEARDSHVEIPELNPDGVGLEEPFNSPLGPIMYPGDPGALPGNTINCRCSLVIRYEPSLERAQS